METGSDTFGKRTMAGKVPPWRNGQGGNLHK